MREILFRGKREDTGEWVYGAPTKDARGHTVIINSVFECEEYSCRGADCLYVGEETVGQFTGVTDKNGKKIFEGDIVENEYGYIGQIVFKACTFYIEWRSGNFTIDLYVMAHSLEIIDNIHDNPELLSRAKRGEPDVMESGVIYAEQDHAENI